jgi:hypothetical protein
VNKYTQFIFNAFITVMTILLIWGTGNYIVKSYIDYGFIPTLISLIIGFPICISIIILTNMIDNKIKKK